MATSRRRTRRNVALTGSDERVSRAIGLLELLSSVEDGIVSAEEAARHLGCTNADLDTAIELIATLADRETGARAVIFRDHGDIVLGGDGAHLMPLRLSLGEGAVLAHVMNALSLAPEVRNRLSRALLPAGISAAGVPLVASATVYGDAYPQLARAIEQHERVRIAYRAHGEEQPSERAVEPLGIESDDDTAYLLARNVTKNALRRYRMERISAVAPTGEHFEVEPESPRDSWDEELAELEVAPGADLPTWQGIAETYPSPTVDGATRVRVHVSSPAWLFDQVLAAGGDLRIVGPQHLVDDLRTYARTLIEDSARA